jgi:hypothetical protein
MRRRTNTSSTYVRPKRKSNTDGSPESRQKESVCYNCGDKGHYSRSCPKSKNRSRDNKNRRQFNLVNGYDSEEASENGHAGKEESSDGSYDSSDATEDDISDEDTDSEQTTKALTVSTSSARDKDHTNKVRFIVSETEKSPVNLPVGGGKLLRQKLICNQVEINPVVDTGEFVSVIDESIVNHLEWKLKQSGMSLVGACCCF